MANEQMRDLWHESAGGWVAHRDLFEAELAGFAEALLEAAGPGPGDRVLDVGCGTGGVLQRFVAQGAVGVGVDISPGMVEAATALVPEARFLVADAQTDDLEALGPFRAVVSRFGVMFFDDPLAAFANIRRATDPDGRLAFVCWRGIEENLMFTLGTSILLDALGSDPAAAPPPDAPGPMSFADPVRVRSVLDGSGWVDVDVAPLEVECDYGFDGSDGIEQRLTMVLNTTTGARAQAELEARLGPERWAALLDEVRAELRRHLVDGRVCFDGATWLVTARNPG